MMTVTHMCDYGCQWYLACLSKTINKSRVVHCTLHWYTGASDGAAVGISCSEHAKPCVWYIRQAWCVISFQAFLLHFSPMLLKSWREWSPGTRLVCPTYIYVHIGNVYLILPETNRIVNRQCYVVVVWIKLVTCLHIELHIILLGT